MDARRDWLIFLQGQGQRLAEIAKRPLNTPRRLYLTGFVLVVVSFFMGGLIDTFWAVVGIAGLGAICVGFLKEIWEKAKTLLASSIAHKVLGVLIAGAVTLPCYSQAHQAVNRITGLSPESFPFSLSFLAMGYAPPMVLTVGMLILSVYSSWQILVFSWHAIRPSAWPIVAFFSRKPTKAEVVFNFLFSFLTLMTRKDQHDYRSEPTRDLHRRLCRSTPSLVQCVNLDNPSSFRSAGGLSAPAARDCALPPTDR